MFTYLGDLHDVHAKLTFLLQHLERRFDGVASAGSYKRFLFRDLLLSHQFDDNLPFFVRGNFSLGQKFPNFSLKREMSIRDLKISQNN